MKKIILTLFILSFVIAKGQDFKCGDYLIDNRDGKIYATVLIGSQCWMKENLNIGLMISNTKVQTDNLLIEKYCYGDDSLNCTKFGALYQWQEAMDYQTSESVQGICPKGWYLPSDNDWKILEIYLGMTQKQADFKNDFRGTDQGTQIIQGGSSGFDALFAGVYHGVNKDFSGIGTYSYFWTSTSDTNAFQYRRGIRYDETRVFRGSANVDESPLYGYCIRCLKNTNSSIFYESDSHDIKIYPNPASDELFIEVNNYESMFSFQINNLLGQIVKTWTSNSAINAVNISDVTGGTYFIKITSNDGPFIIIKKVQIME